jgi:pimeloyl-ACP methyl ester carboxylesterase
MKLLFVLLVLSQFSLSAQYKTKKIVVEGSGVPIVLLAGGTADMSVFSLHSKELSRNYKVIRMEHFNVQYASDNAKLPIDYSVKMESDAIKSTLDSLQIKVPVILVGHSYGGLIALDLALNQPHLIHSMVLIEPPVFALVNRVNESPFGLQDIQELTKQLTPDANITEGHVERFRCLLLNCDSVDIRKLPQWENWVKQKNRLRGLSAVDGYKINPERLQQFQKPVLIITGKQTVAFHKRIDELLADELPNAKAVTMEGGHLCPVTHPKEFLKILLEFIQ